MPFPSCRKPLFQSEAKCDAVDMKNDFFLFSCNLNKTHFHKKVVVLSLVLQNDSFWNSEMDNKRFYENIDAENGKN